MQQQIYPSVGGTGKRQPPHSGSGNPLALDNVEFPGSNSRNVLFGESRDSLKRGLKLRVIISHLGLPGFSGNAHLGADPHQCFRKRLWDHHRIPCLQHPGVTQRYVERRHGQTSLARKQDRTWLCHIFWSSRAVDRKGD